MGKLFGTGVDDSFWLNADFCGLFCASIVYFLLLYAEYVVIFVILEPWKDEYKIIKYEEVIFTILISLALFSHLRAMFTDPGAVPEDALPILSPDLEDPFPHKSKFRTCNKCSTYKPDRTHHCSMCKRCIIKMDHHCPWLNNCVGIGNHKYFLLFLLYTFLSCVMSLYLLLGRFGYCASHSTRLRRGKPVHIENRSIDPVCDNTTSQETIFLFLLAIEAVLFGLFTLCMLCDQSTVVFSAMTQIDRLKNESKKGNSVLYNMMEVFGGDGNGFSCLQLFNFFLPTGVKYKEELREKILGYRQDKVDGFDEVSDFEEYLKKKVESGPEREEMKRFLGSNWSETSE
eukprot:maker-scaffold_3-snap-gene-11.1-mRNA-1 protein AED:0.03 eAED:0.03 QI:81/1/1/1/0.33/0.25/4/228/342